MSAAVAPRTLAPFGRRAVELLANRALGAYSVLTVADPAPAPRGGQFYMLAAVAGWGGRDDERPHLPRACSVLRAPSDGRLEFLFEAVGPGTARLCELQAGEAVWLAGPFGAGFGPRAEADRPLLVGGGVGIAPLAIWQDELGGAGTALLGFRDGAHAEAAALLTEPRIATDDGALGHHGPVTDLLLEELERDAGASVYACGPPGMLEAVRAICTARGIPAQLALEAGMACGFGACFGCVVPLADGSYVRLCVDGPVLDADRLAVVQ